ncbi:site-2 protease family protein [Candidatus Woesearchaeota archaeon]|nr:site-2 protease family protein [Candidatus Woesearchaeota archaeon]
MKISTSKHEIIDLIKSWIVIAIIFTILLKKDPSNILTLTQLALVSAFTVGIGFLLHELAHKVVAQKYGCLAEFRSSDTMLVLALAMAYFLGFVFIAPGAVYIFGNVGIARNGRISLAGPLTNLILAVIFFIIGIFTTGFLSIFASYGFMINSWLALFNLIPVWNFDGKKILEWNKLYYFIAVIVAVLFVFVIR